MGTELEMKCLFVSILALFPIMTVASGNDSIGTGEAACSPFVYPDPISAQIRIDLGKESVDEQLALTESLDVEQDKKAFSNLRTHRMILAALSAQYYASQADAMKYTENVSYLEREVLEAGIPERTKLDLLLVKLYWQSHELDLEPIDHRVLDIAFTSARKKALDDGEYGETLLLTDALYALSQGRTGKAENITKAIPADTRDVNDMFMRGYLLLQIARASSSQTDLENAISALTWAIGDNEDSLQQCDRTLFAMAGYLLADAHLLQGLELAKEKESSVLEVNTKLYEALRQIEKSRVMFDAASFPGLWANAYEKSAEIYEAIGEYSKGRTKRRYEMLQDRSQIIANLY